MSLIEQIDKNRLPQHVAIIMDGNGRWAKAKGKDRSYGHQEGVVSVRKVVEAATTVGLKYLTMYTFSTENWKRPKDEVGALSVLFKQYLEEALRDFLDDDIKVRFIGDTTAFPEELQTLIAETVEVSKNRTGMVLNLAMNYGGRAEIVGAVRQISQDTKDGKLAPEEITEETISAALSTAGQPDPDLIIRPSGEHRISNFLLWQSAYSEYVIMDILWPDFKPRDLEAAIDEYSHRKRRFGGV